MRAIMELRDFSASQINYSEMYKHYISSLYQISGKLGGNQSELPMNLIGGIKSSPSPPRKSEGLWSPAKMVEMEASESGEETGSGKLS